MNDRTEHHKLRLLWLGLAVILGCLLYVPPAYIVHAQTSPVQPTLQTQTAQTTPVPVSIDAVNQIAHNLYCPVCSNTPLEVCQTEACIRWRQQIADLLAQGEDETQIRQYFIDHFGMRTVPIPTDTSSQFIVFGVPLLLIILGGLFIAWQINRWRSTRQQAVPAAVIQESTASGPITDETIDEYRARFEAALKDDK